MSILLYCMMVLYFLISLLLIVYAANYYHLTFRFLRTYKSAQQRNQAVLSNFPLEKIGYPLVTVQLPIFNEKYVAKRLIEHVVQMNYPKERLEIQVLDDSTDETTDLVRAEVEHYQQLGYQINLLHRTNRVGFKAGALKEGVNQSKGDLFAIFDADFLPQPDFLQKTVPFFYDGNLNTNSSYDIVQCRWGHLNSDYSFFTRCQSIGIDGHFSVEQLGRCESGYFLNFNGTAGLFRRSAIERAGGWEHDTLTEDLDLSYRIQMNGGKILFLFEEVVPAEIPPDINAFKQQQYRWAKGSIQCAKKLIPKLLKSRIPWATKLQGCLHLTYYGIHLWIMIILLLSLPMAGFIPYVLTETIMIPMLVLIALSFLGPFFMYANSQRIIHGRWHNIGAILLGMFLIGTGVAINNTRAIFSALLGRYSSFMRTPKFNVLHKKQLFHAQKYHIKVNKQVILEGLVFLYCLGSLIIPIIYPYFSFNPFMAVFALSFGYVAVLSMQHHWCHQ